MNTYLQLWLERIELVQPTGPRPHIYVLSIIDDNMGGKVSFWVQGRPMPVWRRLEEQHPRTKTVEFEGDGLLLYTSNKNTLPASVNFQIYVMRDRTKSRAIGKALKGVLGGDGAKAVGGIVNNVNPAAGVAFGVSREAAQYISGAIESAQDQVLGAFIGGVRIDDREEDWSAVYKGDDANKAHVHVTWDFRELDPEQVARAVNIDILSSVTGTTSAGARSGGRDN